MTSRWQPRWCSQQACLVLVLWTVAAASSVSAQNSRGGWRDQRIVGPFHCRANFSLDGYEPLFDELVKLQQDVTRVLGVKAASAPTELYLFSDRNVYRGYLQQRFPQMPDRRALFVKGSGPGQVFAYYSHELATDLRHECTHALLHSSLPIVPLWLDEGLAEYFEVARQERPYRKDYLTKLKGNLLVGATARLVQLEVKRDLAEMGEGDYCDAWAWVHFMLHGPPQARSELLQFLADMNARTPAGQLSQRLERRLPGLEKRFVDHLSGWPSAPPTPAMR